jgi:cytidylate kinase
MSEPQVIAIDGPVAVGKSTIGLLVAGRLGYRFIDTGMMYRALTWHAMQEKVDLENEDALAELANVTDVDLRFSAGDGRCAICVDGSDVSKEIRRNEVEGNVSLVARAAGVRSAMVAKQRRLAADGRVVMAGRDIGTVVLPEADLKIYLDASPEERARRRHMELDRAGKKSDIDVVLADLKRRDKIDSERSQGPLKPASDAEIVKTDGLEVEQVLAEVMGLVEAGQ